ncbi:MAG TPA: 3'-5' exonuclease [Arsenophonus nasoniae]|uniref:3'-5' exonuclease n=1 Tax=Arsenophonus nasoniae TaxID=638 RepID=UPI003879E251
MKFKHLMLDLETMSTQSNAAIIAIAAVPFEPLTGEVCENLFYEIVDLRNQDLFDRHISGDTVLWWLSQSDNARNKITQAQTKSLPDVLIKLNLFVEHECCEQVQVWGNGCCFDNVILRTAFDNCDIKPFWHFRHDRDVRTIVEFGRQAGIDAKNDFPFAGVAHDALDDALHQVNYVSAIHQHLIKQKIM